MRIEEYGPIRKYRIYNLLMLLLVVSSIGAVYLVHRHYESRLLEMSLYEEDLLQRQYSVTSANSELNKKLKTMERQFQAIDMEKPVEPQKELVVKADGFVAKDQVREGQHTSIQGKITVSVKKILGRKAHFQVEVPVSGFLQKVWMNVDGVFEFSYNSTNLQLKALEINPYDRQCTFLIMKTP